MRLRVHVPPQTIAPIATDHAKGAGGYILVFFGCFGLFLPIF